MPTSSVKFIALCVALSAVAGPTGLGVTRAQALTTEDILNYQGADRQKMLVDGARTEGTVVIYSGMIVNQLLRPMVDGFEKRYPFLKARYWRGDGNQVAVKLNAEIRANALEADVVEGSGMPAAIGGSKIVLPFASPMFEALPKEAVAPDRTWAATRLRYIGLGYNTKFIAKDDAPKGYNDLLNPRWKGKMAWHTGSDASGALVTISTLLATWGMQKTDAYLARLARQDITPLSVSNRQVVDQVILGEYWMGIGISAHHPVISAGRGAPAATVLLDPTPNVVQVLKGIRHPHAAVLFVDFMLSAEGQRLVQAAEYVPSSRSVEPLPNLKAIVPRNAGVPELILTSELLEQLTPKSVELYRRHFR